MPLPTPATAVPPGPMAHLPGTGGPTFFRTLNVTGWQATWKPEDGCHALVAAKRAANPALVLDLPPGDDADAALKAAASAFGKARGGA